MSVRIPWSLSEAVVLLDALITYLAGKKSLNQTITDVSLLLRRYTLHNGQEIDDKFRDENGIRLQLQVMEYYFTDGKHGLN